MAIEIVDFPIKNGGSFHCYVSSPEGKTPAQASHNAMATGILQQRRQRRGRAITGAQAAQGCGGFGSHQAAALVLGAVLKGQWP